MDISVSKLNSDDLKQLYYWDLDYAGKPEFQNITTYILESDHTKSLFELVDSFNKISDTPYEKTRVYVARNKKELLGFIACRLREDSDFDSSVFMSYIVTNPKFQHSGVANNMLKELFSNPKKYFGFSPKFYTGVVKPTNLNCLKLFSKYGFEGQIFQNQILIRADSDTILQKMNENQKI